MTNYNTLIRHLQKTFDDNLLPSKIKKTKLLENVGLPVPDTDYFTAQEIKKLKDKIRIRFKKQGGPLILRVACIPDKYTMPSFYIETLRDAPNIIKKLKNKTY